MRLKGYLRVNLEEAYVYDVVETLERHKDERVIDD